ncbi:hypothetical protein [Granulicoccus sp. GXG6511]|uniref:hypothetical protein n=1 Tax=Granulicoccus sp. GXG6511 TaxID=3381351 RepID=UPI003D7D0025
MMTSPHHHQRPACPALDMTDAYYGRVADIQAVLHDRVTGLLSVVPDGHGCREFLSTFLRVDAEFSAVQNSLSELHAALGRAGAVEPGQGNDR